MLKSWLLYALDQIVEQGTRDAADRARSLRLLLEPLALDEQLPYVERGTFTSTEPWRH